MGMPWSLPGTASPSNIYWPVIELDLCKYNGLAIYRSIVVDSRALFNRIFFYIALNDLRFDRTSYFISS